MHGTWEILKDPNIPDERADAVLRLTRNLVDAWKAAGVRRGRATLGYSFDTDTFKLRVGTLKREHLIPSEWAEDRDRQAHLRSVLDRAIGG